MTLKPEKIEYELVVEKRALVGEGAIWDEDNNLLYWIDILGHEVYQYNPKTKANRTIHTLQAVGTVVLRSKGGLVVALHNGFGCIDLETEKIIPIGSDPEREKTNNRFNDGKCDPAGRFWAGTMAFDGSTDRGALYCLDVDATVTKKLGPVSISNGIVWSSDYSTMYFIDSTLNNVRAYDYEIETGRIQNERIVCRNEGEGVFDGMAIDAEGLLWIAVYGGSAIKCYDPRNGLLKRELNMPFLNVTSCAFGGEKLDRLYVTSACQRMSESDLNKQPLAGSLISLDPGCVGVPSFKYEG